MNQNIPILESRWTSLNNTARKKAVLDYFRTYLKDKTVVNRDTGLTIRITMASGRKTAYGEAMYSKKAEVVRILPDLIEQAIYNNFGQRKQGDNKDILGYLNFKAKCILDGKVEHLRIAVQFQKGGKFYYNVEVNKIK
ncbi:MAG: hypothetical protein K5846_08710 [Bacteroidales bacterium]|nr:hypothetical protein [Bacteroidales bacterium]